MKREEILERARALAPKLRERAAETEEKRQLPDQSVRDLEAAGLFRIVQPERWGGLELDPGSFYEAVIEVGRGCGSTAWVLGVVGVHSWQLALFPEQAQADVWGSDPTTLVSSSYAPTGAVEAVDGGYLLRGRWSFSSGCDLCDWVFVGGVVPGDRAEGEPADFRTFLVPRSDYAIDDVWHVSGLCGTGSKDIVMEGAFVPEHRTHRFMDAFRFASPGHAVNPGPLYRLPFGCVFCYAIAAPAVGLALGALEDFTELSRNRLGMALGAARDNPLVHKRLADAASRVDAVRLRLLRDFDEMYDLARAGSEISLEQRGRYRFDAADCVQASADAVDHMFEASGGRAIFLDHPAQRAFRDVHAMRQHAMNNPDVSASLLAKTRLGLPVTDVFL